MARKSRRFQNHFQEHDQPRPEMSSSRTVDRLGGSHIAGIPCTANTDTIILLIHALERHCQWFTGLFRARQSLLNDQSVVQTETLPPRETGGPLDSEGKQKSCVWQSSDALESPCPPKTCRINTQLLEGETDQPGCPEDGSQICLPACKLQRAPGMELLWVISHVGVCSCKEPLTHTAVSDLN